MCSASGRGTCRETHGRARRRQNGPAGAGHKDKTQQTQAAARKALIRKTCSIFDGLPRARERCHTRSAGLASSPQRRHPSLALLGGKRHQETGVRHRQTLPARSRRPPRDGAFTSRQRRPRERRAAIGVRGSARGAGDPGASSVLGTLTAAGTAPLPRTERPGRRCSEKSSRRGGARSSVCTRRAGQRKGGPAP